jgi:hypothetical protein
VLEGSKQNKPKLNKQKTNPKYILGPSTRHLNKVIMFFFARKLIKRGLILYNFQQLSYRCQKWDQRCHLGFFCPMAFSLFSIKTWSGKIGMKFVQCEKNRNSSAGPNTAESCLYRATPCKLAFSGCPPFDTHSMRRKQPSHSPCWGGRDGEGEWEVARVLLLFSVPSPFPRWHWMGVWRKQEYICPPFHLQKK